MRYEIKDIDGKTIKTGDNVADVLGWIEIPTCGSISLELSPGRWLNVQTNEDIGLSITPTPQGNEPS